MEDSFGRSVYIEKSTVGSFLNMVKEYSGMSFSKVAGRKVTLLDLRVT